ncbi:hypothetical protein ABZP36_034855 [Zizania latifolia]
MAEEVATTSEVDAMIYSECSVVKKTADGAVLFRHTLLPSMNFHVRGLRHPEAGASNFITGLTVLIALTSLESMANQEFTFEGASHACVLCEASLLIRFLYPRSLTVWMCVALMHDLQSRFHKVTEESREVDFGVWTMRVMENVELEIMALKEATSLHSPASTAPARSSRTIF